MVGMIIKGMIQSPKLLEDVKKGDLIIWDMNRNVAYKAKDSYYADYFYEQCFCPFTFATQALFVIFSCLLGTVLGIIVGRLLV